MNTQIEMDRPNPFALSLVVGLPRLRQAQHERRVVQTNIIGTLNTTHGDFL